MPRQEFYPGLNVFFFPLFWWCVARPRKWREKRGKKYLAWKKVTDLKTDEIKHFSYQKYERC